MTVAVLGYEGSGRLIVEALIFEGMDVRCFAPGVTQIPDGVVRVQTMNEAVEGAEFVISLATPRHTIETAQLCKDLLQPNALYLDLSASSGNTKAKVEESITDHGRVIDGAVIEPAELSAGNVQVLLSGDSSNEVAHILRNVGVRAKAIQGPVGAASTRMVLLSVFVQAAHALADETIQLGETVHAADWLRQQITRILPMRQDDYETHSGKSKGNTSLTIGESYRALEEINPDPSDWPGLGSALERHAREKYRTEAEETTFRDLTRLSTAAIGDGYDRLGFVGSALSRVWDSPPISGPAFTVMTQAGDNHAIHQALKHVKPGDILVVSAERGRERALIGDLIAERAKNAGIAGIIVDGPIRDRQGIIEVGVPVWAAGISAAGPYKAGPARLGTPVAIGNAVCQHGDVVIADDEGILFIPPHHIPEVIRSARRVLDDEEAKRLAIRQESVGYKQQKYAKQNEKELKATNPNRPVN